MKKLTLLTIIALMLMLATMAPMHTAAFEIEAVDETDGDDVPPPPPPPPPQPTWQRIGYYGSITGSVSDIAFGGNNLVCFGSGNHIFSWNFTTGTVWQVDHGDYQNRVTHVAIPRRNSSVVIYGYGWFRRGRLEMRRTDNLSFIADARAYDELGDLSVDELGDYVVGHTVGPNNSRFDPRHFTFDLWGSNGWQLQRNQMDERGTYASGIHPVRKDGFPHRYFCFWDDPDAIREKRGHQWRWGHTYITGSASNIPVLDIAVGMFQGSTRVAGLLRNSRIDVWDRFGSRLFTFNKHGVYFLNRILEFTPNGELLATATDRKVIFWDLSTRAKDPSSFTPDIPSHTPITALAISNSGKRVAVGSEIGAVYIYEWTGGSTPAAPAQEAEPAQPTALLSNYPNPFNPETWIPYQLAEPAEVKVSIYSADGKLVRTLELGQVPAGVYSEKDRAAYWDGQNEQGEPVASGVYFYTLKAGEFSATRKMVIRK